MIKKWINNIFLFSLYFFILNIIHFIILNIIIGNYIELNKIKSDL